MYLPAIPKLVEIWQQPLAIVNLTLVGFFVSYCFSLLLYGPLSDALAGGDRFWWESVFLS